MEGCTPEEMAEKKKVSSVEGGKRHGKGKGKKGRGKKRVK